MTLISPRWEVLLLRLWHAALAGGFVVAFATGDEDTYRMHLFAGTWVLAALAIRLLLSLLATPGGALSFRKTRGPAFRLAAPVLLPAVAVAGISGWMADVLPAIEDIHEGLSHAALWVVLAHGAVMAWVFQGGRLRRLMSGAALLGLVLAAVPAQAADPARDAILAAYGKEAAQPFVAARGEALYRSRNAATPDLPACATCHTDDPTLQGRHAKTGRSIAPVAVSANPKRFTDAAKVEERFTRDCQTVLGRACTAQEKGDYITFLAGK